MDAVAAAQEKHPAITVLQGSEVDILPDGSLDFPDAVLERLDVVLASLHDVAGHPAPQLTDRYIRAMHNPFVQIVTHPTNRLVPSRDGYDAGRADGSSTPQSRPAPSSRSTARPAISTWTAPWRAAR